MFRRFIDGPVTPERYLEACYVRRTRLELVAARKRRRQLTKDGNVAITDRDICDEKNSREAEPGLSRSG
ncbi:MAG: hypothetical protein AB7H90_20715 [Alphaproteobacteria bacterium]